MTFHSRLMPWGFWTRPSPQINYKARSKMDDYVSLVTMMRRVMRLSLGAYLFRSPSLAAAAAAHLSAWFVHPATAMRPSLANAQGIPGVTTGKATGAMDLFYAGRGWTDAVALLGATPEAAAAWPPRDAAVVRSWAAAMADYLTGAPRMRREAAMVNNHGVYWDLTVLALARLAGNATLAAAVTGPPGCPVGGGAPIVGCVPARLAAQVDAAGAQVAELGRAFPGHYVWYTLMAHAHLAALASSTSGHRAHPSGGSNNTIPLPPSPHPVSAVTPALVAAAAWAAPHATAPPGVPIDGGYGYAAAAYRLVARLTGDPASAAVACNVLGVRAARGGDAALWDDGGVITAVVALALPPPAGVLGCAVWEARGQQQQWAEPGGGGAAAAASATVAPAASPAAAAATPGGSGRDGGGTPPFAAGRQVAPVARAVAGRWWAGRSVAVAAAAAAVAAATVVVAAVGAAARAAAARRRGSKPPAHSRRAVPTSRTWRWDGVSRGVGVRVGWPVSRPSWHA